MVLDSAKPEKREATNDGKNTQNYEVFDLNQDMGAGDTWTGDPYLTKVFKNDYGYSASIYISNHENEEKLRARLKVKSEDDKQSFWDGSLGFDLIKSIKQVSGEQIKDDVNVFDMSFTELQKYLNDEVDELTVQVINHTAEIRGEIRNWNTLQVTKIGE